jgi:hypothetical protein
MALRFAVMERQSVPEGVDMSARQLNQILEGEQSLTPIENLDWAHPDLEGQQANEMRIPPIKIID